MGSKYEWKFRARNSEDIKILGRSKMTNVSQHPLNSSQESKTKKSSKTISTKMTKMTISNPLSDPLSSFGDPLSDPLSSFMDPLDEPIQSKPDKNKTTGTAKINPYEEDWKKRRKDILGSYTTSEKVPSLFADSKPEKEVSSEDFVQQMEDLHNTMKTCWGTEQRVQSLKYVIQCLKTLSDTSVIEFYPSKFILVTDLLDSFVHLIFERLKSKSPRFPDEIPEDTSEVCRNWFHKIASIRELVPRFYIESAMLGCGMFMDEFNMKETIVRLSQTIRGIGDPLKAAYARMYLAKCIGINDQFNETLLKETYEEFVSVFSDVGEDIIKYIPGFSLLDYVHLFRPVSDWIILCLTRHTSEKNVLECFEESKKLSQNAIIIESFLLRMSPSIISGHTMKVISVALTPQTNSTMTRGLVISLGKCLLNCNQSIGDKLHILNTVWKIITTLPTLSDYIQCAEVWTEFTAKNFGSKEVGKLLNDIIKHVQAAPNSTAADKETNASLQIIINKVLNNINGGVMELIGLAPFLPYLTLFTKENHRVETSKAVLDALTKTNSDDPINDRVTIDVLITLCKSIGNSVTALTSQDEERQISELINHVITKSDFLPNKEKQYRFYTENRAGFSHLDLVQVNLVRLVNRLATVTTQPSEKSFTQALAAFSYITIPSLRSPQTKLKLYLESAQVCLMNHCLGQADACFKTAIQQISTLPTSPTNEAWLRNYLSSLFSTLLVVPDNTEHGILYLIRSALNSINKYPWDKSLPHKSLVFVDVLRLFSSVCQDTFPYGYNGLDSNDVLYGGDPKFTSEVENMATTVLQLLLEHIQYLNEVGEEVAQAKVCVNLLTGLIDFADLGQSKKLTSLALNVGKMAYQQKKVDKNEQASLRRYLNHLQQSEHVNNEIVRKIAEKIVS